jgi:hypothetical protein
MTLTKRKKKDNIKEEYNVHKNVCLKNIVRVLQILID